MIREYFLFLLFFLILASCRGLDPLPEKPNDASTGSENEETATAWPSDKPIDDSEVDSIKGQAIRIPRTTSAHSYVENKSAGQKISVHNSILTARRENGSAMSLKSELVDSGEAYQPSGGTVIEIVVNSTLSIEGPIARIDAPIDV